MNIISQITNLPLQLMNVPLPDGSLFSMTLYFIPQQYGWFITNLTYNSFVLNGFRVCNSPNMLLQYQNQIPFGLACYSVANREPQLQNDFVSGNSQLYVLTQAECEEFYTFLQTGAT